MNQLHLTTTPFYPSDTSLCKILVQVISNIILETGHTEKQYQVNNIPCHNHHSNKDSRGMYKCSKCGKHKQPGSRECVHFKLNLLQAGIQLGHTKVFLRRWAFDILEQSLAQKKYKQLLLFKLWLDVT